MYMEHQKLISLHILDANVKYLTLTLCQEQHPDDETYCTASWKKPNNISKHFTEKAGKNKQIK